MKRFCLALLLVPLASCAVDIDEEWYGDPRFTEEERARIITGASAFYASAGIPRRTIRWDGEGPNKVTIVRMTSASDVVCCDSTKESCCVKRYAGLGFIYLNPDVAGNALEAAVLREMGRCGPDVAAEPASPRAEEAVSPPPPLVVPVVEDPCGGDVACPELL